MENRDTSDGLLKYLTSLQAQARDLANILGVEKMEEDEAVLRRIMARSDFWQNQLEAVKISRKAELLAKDLQRFKNLASSLAEGQEIAELAIMEDDKELVADIFRKAELWSNELDKLENLSLYGGPYDEHDAIMSVSAGTGGVDAQDWTQMLERMYLRFAESQGWKVEILDRLLGNEAGLKSVSLKISGLRAYGNLKSENGTHRLLRNSPFNADGLRQTSFASVELIPDIPAAEIVIRDEDIRLDVFRSSGPGGQSVNTTDSAVRIVHLPSGITVSCQTERSQHQNKENAFAILRARLVKLELEKKEEEEKRLKGGVKAEWGQQIRSYWFYGNRLVKDHRSGFEDSDVDGVVNGKLEGFVAAYLRWQRSSG